MAVGRDGGCGTHVAAGGNQYLALEEAPSPDSRENVTALQVWKIALQGPCYMTLLMITFGLLWGHLLQIRPAQSVFISTCLSLSSTPLVSRFLGGSARGEKEAGDIDYSAVLLGMLVVQDVQLGLFIAAMPTLIQAGASAHASIVMETLRVLALAGQIVFSLAAVFLLCLVIRTYLMGPYYRKLRAESSGNKEILVLGTSAFIFLLLMVTERLDVSMELGCFLAGALVSSQGHKVTEEVVSYIEPIRDFLAIVFFASIGLHVFPTFVLYELTILMALTLLVVIMKFVLAALVLSLLLPKTSQYIKWIVAAGLAQVSEFSFVLGSRARRAGIISREDVCNRSEPLGQGEGSSPARSQHPASPVQAPPAGAMRPVKPTLSGVPPDPQCDHAQPFAGPSAVEGCDHKVCAAAREAVEPLSIRKRKGFSEQSCVWDGGDPAARLWPFLF
ncbi:hypothetical protein MC885_014194, partial [Smutsia gigantea]